MQIQVTFRHFNGHHPQLNQAAINLAESFAKYNDSIISVNVEFINENQKIVNFTVHIQGATLASTEATDDLHTSLTLAGDKIIKQLLKHKEKKNERNAG
jgi:ribosomal subunit interface protein